ncbi:uncharacterized protein LOC131227305 [Magnolia sinica]|uniref:uncharacterized protein LOC131227305 n=1 Tax=Magnolia sinica TaxID=86752 RepID=UPI0026590A9C|nr:uncharacterized protein LOC131227305 [Magnolia sinica]
MKKSPMYPKYENGDVFDPHLDFSMFLEEAKKHASDASSVLPSSNYAEKQVAVDEKKNKKSWKISFFFWRKSEKKMKPQHEMLPIESHGGFQVPKPRRSAVSGPIYGSGGRVGPANRSGRRPTSGPLSGLLTPTRREEFEIPYMCLDQLNHPSRSQSQAFGPIYLVT